MMRATTWGRAAIAIGLLVTMAACEGEIADPPPVGRKVPVSWAAPARYSYDLESSCGERTLIGEFRIRVEQGEVVHFDALDESAEALVQTGFSDAVPTLEALVDEAVDAENSGADVVNVEHEGPRGSPSLIEIDHRTDGIDDEACYEITRFRRNPPPLPDCETTTSEADAAARARISPCEVASDEEPRLTMWNEGGVRFAYGTPFKLERKVDGAWRWINEGQGWDLPLFHLPVGERSRGEEIYHWIRNDTQKRLRPGLYRVTKALNVGDVHGPVMNVTAFFRVLEEGPA